MSKSTRIFELVHMLGGRRPRTVAEIAETLEVSERTAFRYLADLQAQHKWRHVDPWQVFEREGAW